MKKNINILLICVTFFGLVSQAFAKDVVFKANEEFFASFDQNLTYEYRAQPFEMTILEKVTVKRPKILGAIQLSDKTTYSFGEFKTLAFSNAKLIGNLGRTKKAAFFNRGSYFEVNITGIKLANGDVYPVKVKMLKVIDKHYSRIIGGEKRIQAKGRFWEKVGKDPNTNWDLMDYIIAPIFGAIGGIPSLISKGSDLNLYKGLNVKLELEQNIEIPISAL